MEVGNWDSPWAPGRTWPALADQATHLPLALPQPPRARTWQWTTPYSAQKDRIMCPADASWQEMQAEPGCLLQSWSQRLQGQQVSQETGHAAGPPDQPWFSAVSLWAMCAPHPRSYSQSART